MQCILSLQEYCQLYNCKDQCPLYLHLLWCNCRDHLHLFLFSVILKSLYKNILFHCTLAFWLLVIAMYHYQYVCTTLHRTPCMSCPQCTGTLLFPLTQVSSFLELVKYWVIHILLLKIENIIY